MTHEFLSQTSTEASDDGQNLDPELAHLGGIIAAKGATLLVNNSVLPLDATAPLAVFGRVARDWIAVGYGSGGDVNPPYITNLTSSLKELGVPIDAELAATYEDWCAENPVDPGDVWGKWPLSFPEMPISNAQIEGTATRCDTAVVVIGRAAGEDRESVLEPGSYYLTEDERSMLERVSQSFKHTVAVVVTGNVMDLSWADQMDIDGLLLAWAGGQEGGRAIAKVLVGELEPGGRLPDTVAYRYEDYPSYGHFGDPDANAYVEDIYVGYRYFETFAKDKVQFPFGFGLGYSTHEYSNVSVEFTDEGVAVSGTVTNTGTATSSAAPQLYVRKPGKLNGAPERELVGFWRSPDLDPNQSADFTITVTKHALAVYDDIPERETAFCWVVEEGDYDFFLGNDVREAREVGSVNLEQQVLEQLEQAAAPVVAFDRFIRKGRASKPDFDPVPMSEVDLAARIMERLPKSAGSPVNEPRFDDVLAERVTVDDFVASLSHRDLADLTYGDVTMNSPLGAPGNAGALGGVTESLRSRGVPPAITTDGPSGLRLNATATLLPCGTALASTWDPDLV